MNRAWFDKRACLESGFLVKILERVTEEPDWFQWFC
jgi:hypothetical protein